MESGPSSDIGRIQRQNLIISAALNKAKSTYNPSELNALLTSVVHDFSKDDGLSPTDLYSLAERYKAFSGSQLQAYTLPTVGATRRRRIRRGGPAPRLRPDDQPVPRGSLGTISTPPLSAYGQPLTLTVPPTTVAPPTAAAPSATGAPLSERHCAAPPASTVPSYDPRPC